MEIKRPAFTRFISFLLESINVEIGGRDFVATARKDSVEQKQ
jgi:hypothetical protein